MQPSLSSGARLAFLIRHPLVWSLVLHFALLRILSPGHDDDHSVQWFEGTLELGEAGDGHAEHLHFHQDKKVAPPLPTEPGLPLTGQGTESKSEEPSSPIDLQSSGAPGVGGAPLTEEQRYLLGLARQLDALKSYPRDSLLKEEEGSVLLTLVIERDGRVASSEITQPCPFAGLNRAALEAARKLSNLPPLPSSWTRSIRVRIPMSYQLSR